MNRDEVEDELTRRFKEAFLPGMENTEQVRQLATQIATEMACEEKYAPFFAHLYSPQAYSVSCRGSDDPHQLITDIELRDPLLIEAYLKNKETN